MADKNNENEIVDVVGDDEEEAMVVTLEYDDGTTVETEVMGIFEVDGKEYIALIPNDKSDDVYIYGYKEIDEDTIDLVDIEDDKEFEKAVAEFDKLVFTEE
jgi:hypothetical protein